MTTMTSSQARGGVDTFLTGQTDGYTVQTNVGHYLFPVVTVNARAKTVVTFDSKQEFMSYDIIRSPGGDVEEIQLRRGTRKIALDQYAMAGKVPRETSEDGASIGIDDKLEAVESVATIQEGTQERIKATIATNPSTYDASHVVTPAKLWDDPTDPGNPITTIDDLSLKIADDCLYLPNTLIIPLWVWKKGFKNNPFMKEILADNKQKILTPSIVKDQFDTPLNVVIAQSAGADDNGNFTRYWGNNVVLAYVAPNPKSRKVKSFGYTYRLEGHPFVQPMVWSWKNQSFMFPRFDETQIAVVSPNCGALVQAPVASS